MKIGIDARLWNQTGVGRYIRNLVWSLEKIDKKNEYILFVRDEDKVKIKSKNFRTVSANIKWHSFDEQFEFINLLHKEILDLVHFPYYSVPVFYRKPFVVTIHDLIPLHFQTGKASTLPFPLYKFKFFAYRFVVSQAARNASRIIAPSNFSKDEIVRLLRVKSLKVRVVYERVDDALVTNSNDSKEHFLYVGNAYPHKNLEFLLKVFKELPSEKLILVGKEDYFYNRIKKIADRRKLSNVKFFGYATDSELSSLYRKAKALIIPSFIEGFGLPALEAMANNCSVLASDIPVHREICQDAAVYFNPYSSDDLLDKIKKLEELEDKRKSGRKHIEKFSWEKTAQQTLKIYESCYSLRSS